MTKKSLPRQLADTEAKAVARVLRTSPRKLNLVAQTIRGKAANVALSEPPSPMQKTNISSMSPGSTSPWRRWAAASS